MPARPGATDNGDQIPGVDRKSRPADSLDVPLVRELIDAAPDGLAVVAENGSTIYLNAAGRELLGASQAHSTSPLTEWAHGSERQGTVRLGRREISYHRVPLTTLHETLLAVYFRDVTSTRQRDRQVRTFAQAAASIAFSHDLFSLLDRLAEQVRTASSMYSCTFLLYDEDGDLQQAGTAGKYPQTPDYSRRLRRCKDLGAPLLADIAVKERRPIIQPGWRRFTLSDPRFAPIHDISHGDQWDTIVVVPLVMRDKVLGVFNGFYPHDHQPHESDLPFLTAIADQAAVAIDNSRLLAAAEHQAALEERHRLARELHDSVNQILFSLSLRTRALEMEVSTHPEMTPLAENLAAVAELSADALVEMRALIFQLRPAALHEEGLVSAIRKHATALAAREGLEIELQLPSLDVQVEADAEEQLFRVLQEALHNVVKHVPHASVRVELHAPAVPGHELVLVVHDDGQGFDPGAHSPGHFGLQTMAERMQALGGRLTVSSRSNGTTVRASVSNAIAPVGQEGP
jgi:signal transduction histidine kinase